MPVHSDAEERDLAFFFSFFIVLFWKRVTRVEEVAFVDTTGSRETRTSSTMILSTSLFAEIGANGPYGTSGL